MGSMSMSMPSIQRAYALGDAPQIIMGEVGAAVPVATAAIAGSALTVPIVGAVIAGVTLLIGSWLNSIAKHNAEKSAATQIVNQAEPYLQQNLRAYESLVSPTDSEKAQALRNFDAIWAQVVQACGNASLEDAGRRCIGDRSPGGQWNWFAYYRDPIQNSVSVQDSSLEDVATVLGGGALDAPALQGLLLPALLIGAALLMSSD